MNFIAKDIDMYAAPLKGFGNSEISVNENYITKENKPWIPIMGELHFSRVAEKDWERELIKMKKGGIEVVSSYLFWIHHEESESEFDWSNNRNLRKFIMLCEKHGLYFFLRPGPWAHGECRNGGFPNWLLEKCGENTRCNKEPYLTYIKRFFSEISEQIKNLTNIIGIQVENEKIDDPDYLLEVKQMIIDFGMNAPIFTATAWGHYPRTPARELLPVFGGYPEAPWEKNTKELTPNCHYFFSTERNDTVIGNDLLTIRDIAGEPFESKIKTPFLTCELGGGNQITYHRRPIIKPPDVTALSMTILGSGCNLLGYYMYHGGSNPIGKFSTMQESKKTNYANDYPIISYDFNAPIGECGQIRDSYYGLANIHSFVKNYGEILAPMQCVLPNEEYRPKDKFDNDTLRCSVRSDGKSGFLFVNNYQRLVTLPLHTDVNISIELDNETLQISNMTVPENSIFLIPFNLKMGDKLLKYAFAQPYSIKDNVWTFLKIDGVLPHFYFEDFDFIFTDNEYKLDDLTIKLIENQPHPKTTGKNIKVVKVENSISFDYFEELGFADRTVEYAVDLKGADADYLMINCMGNVMHVYCDKKLIADYYCDGLQTVVDVRDYKEKEIVLKIQPLFESDDIYFEIKMVYGEVIPIVTAIKGSYIAV